MTICIRRRVVVPILACLLLLNSGCGYLLYPERVGRTEGRVDPAVIALDAASLLFGIIPGIVAFAVDISTGTIYLPEGEENVIEKHQKRLSSGSEQVQLQAVDAHDVDLNTEDLAQRLSEHLHRPVEGHDIVLYRIAMDAG